MFSCKPSSTVSDLASAQNTNNRTSSSNSASSTGSSSTSNANSSSTSSSKRIFIFNKSTIPERLGDVIKRKKANDQLFSGINSEFYYLPIPVNHTAKALDAIKNAFPGMNSLQKDPGTYRLSQLNYEGGIDSPVIFDVETSSLTLDFENPEHPSAEITTQSTSIKKQILSFQTWKCNDNDVKAAKELYDFPDGSEFYLLFFQTFVIKEKVIIDSSFGGLPKTSGEVNVFLAPINWDDLSMFGTYRLSTDPSCDDDDTP